MTDCELFLDRVNAVLDGEAAASELATAHAQTCRHCRELAAAARLLASAGPTLQAMPPVPTELTPKLVAAMTRGRRRHWLPGLAASVLVVAGFVGWAESSRPTPVATAPTVGVESLAHPTRPPRVADQFAAVASVARSASEQATAPTRLLSTPNLKLATAAKPAADPLATLNAAGKSAAAPVADTTRRAVGFFLRDLGLSAKPAG